jgi:hypothetical protein
MLAVRWYLRYGLSYRDVEELLAERGITVDHVTIYRWVQRFTPLAIDAARPCRHTPGDRWFADETYVKVAGRWVYLYRAIDQFGQVIDVLLSEKRDLAATRRFFTRAPQHGSRPTEVSTRPFESGGDHPPECPAIYAATSTGPPVWVKPDYQRRKGAEGSLSRTWGSDKVPIETVRGSVLDADGRSPGTRVDDLPQI